MNKNKLKLEKICTFFNGRIKPNSKGKIPVYGGNGIISYTDQYNADNILVIGRVGAYCGNAFYSRNKCWVSDNAIGIILNENVSNIKYIFYFLEKMNIRNLAIGSSQPLITQDILKNIEIDLPSLEEQKRIADILTALDDKIELNNQMNQTLEEIASLLYKRWFVDFEFPDDKGNPYKSSGGEMVDSKLGMIPKGWEVKELGDICETIASGSTPSKIDVDNALDTSNELIGFIKVKDIINSEIQFSKIEFIPLLISEEKMRRSILKENDILLSMAGTIGRTARVSKEFSNMNINQALATIRAEDIIMIPYVYCWINSIATQDSFKSKTVHAVQANLSLSSIRKQKILIPETKVIKSYYNKINYNFKKIDLNILEINKLKKIKINYLKILL
jgi:type I restriction enzyme S subunit